MEQYLTFNSLPDSHAIIAGATISFISNLSIPYRILTYKSVTPQDEEAVNFQFPTGFSLP